MSVYFLLSFLFFFLSLCFSSLFYFLFVYFTPFFLSLCLSSVSFLPFSLFFFSFLPFSLFSSLPPSYLISLFNFLFSLLSCFLFSLYFSSLLPFILSSLSLFLLSLISSFLFSLFIFYSVEKCTCLPLFVRFGIEIFFKEVPWVLCLVLLFIYFLPDCLV